jgi:hypothetical protein
MLNPEAESRMGLSEEGGRGKGEMMVKGSRIQNYTGKTGGISSRDPLYNLAAPVNNDVLYP